MNEIRRVDDHSLDIYAKHLEKIGFVQPEESENVNNVASLQSDGMPTVMPSTIKLSSMKKFKRVANGNTDES